MKAMARFSAAWALALVGAGLYAADEPRLVKQREVFGPEETYETGGKTHGLGYMRLSPDGQRVLCIRRQVLEVAGGDPPSPGPPARSRRSPGREVRRLVLRELGTGKDRLVPVPPCAWEDIFVKMVMRNVFDPAGSALVLAGGAAGPAGVFEIGQGKMQAVRYDIAADTIQPLAQAEELVLPQFDGAGRGLLIMTAEKTGGRLYWLAWPEMRLQRLNVYGMPMLPCPTADLVPLFYRDRDNDRLKFVLYDFRADKEVAPLPVHPGNTLLEDIPAQWTSEGRYLYYCDLESPADGEGPSRALTRIYDRQQNRLLAKMENAFPVGAGPAPATMVMGLAENAKAPPGMVLHDAASGQVWTLSEAPAGIFYAGGGKVLYARKTQGGGLATVLAEIDAPALASRPALGVAPRPAPVRPPTPTAPAPPGLGAEPGPASRPAKEAPAPPRPTTSRPERKVTTEPAFWRLLEREFGIERVP
jgi:hypothetical protein